MPTLTYDIKVGSRAGISQEYKNPPLRLSEIDDNRSVILETYTSVGSISKFGWESELILFDEFGKISSGSMSFLKDNSSVSAANGYGFIPTSSKIKLKSYVPVSASIYKRGLLSDSVYIKYSNSKDHKYYITTTRVGELDHIEEDSHNHGINLEEAGELAIEISHIVIDEEKTKTSSDSVIKLDYYPVTNVSVEGSEGYTINEYSGIIINKTGAELTIKYKLAPLVIIHNGPAVYTDVIDPSIVLNLLEINNKSEDGIVSSGNTITSNRSFFLETSEAVDIDNTVYYPGKRYILSPGKYTLSPASSEWTRETLSKINESDITAINDIKLKLLSRYKAGGANPISYNSVANGDVYKIKDNPQSGVYSLEVVVDDKNRRVILPHLTDKDSISIVRIGHRNSRTEVTDYDKDDTGTIRLNSNGRYIIKYTPIKEDEWVESNSNILNSIIAALGTPQREVKIYYGTEENGSVEYLNIDNPIIIGNNNG